MLDYLQIKLAKSLRRVFSKIPLTNFFEKKIENKYYRQDLNIPPIFIVGAPRSGTTLLYQLLLKEFDLFYFSNTSNVFYNSPLLVNYLIKNQVKKKNVSLKSNSGFIKGFFSPSEIGILNEKWFENTINKQQTKKLFFTITNLYQRPILIKNTFNTLRVDNIKELFPNALIIFITRNSFFNAQSIILNHKGYKALERLHNKLPTKTNNPNIFIQAVELLYNFKFIKTQIAEKYQNNLIEIEYENLCFNPGPYMDKIQNWFIENNFSVCRKNVVESINIKEKNTVKLKVEDEKKLNFLIDKYFILNSETD